MDGYTAPNPVEVTEDDNVIAAFLENAKTAPNRPALGYREGDSFIDVNSGEFASTVRELAAESIGLGIQPGGLICIFMRRVPSSPTSITQSGGQVQPPITICDGRSDVPLTRSEWA